MNDKDSDITKTVLRERSRLGQFIRRRVGDQTDAEDILQDVFHEFIDAYRLPASIEHVSAWLFRVARYRIVDRFRKKKEEALDAHGDTDDDAGYNAYRGGVDAVVDGADGPVRLDLALPAADGDPEADYARKALLAELQAALEDLPANQRQVFIAHEIEGISFKDMAAATGVGMNTLLARKRYAVRYLRDRLQPIYDELDF